MTSTAAVLATVVAALAGALGTYLAAARRFSGSIANTEATRLWDASEQLRKEYHDRLNTLNGVVARCEERVLRVEDRNEELTRENERLRQQVDEQEHTIAKLQAEVDRLSEENKQLVEAQNGAKEH